jgi:hypothetical protein
LRIFLRFVNILRIVSRNGAINVAQVAVSFDKYHFFALAAPDIVVYSCASIRVCADRGLEFTSRLRQRGAKPMPRR